MDFPLHIEVIQKFSSVISKGNLIELVSRYLQSFASITPGNSLGQGDFDDYPEVNHHVRSINFCDVNQHKACVDMKNIEVRYHVYKLDTVQCSTDTMDGDNEEDLPAFNSWQLPSEDFLGLWENLIYDTKVKEDTLNFVETTLLFSDRSINSNIINWNRVMLLHGPPGTGKTSLCKALAQKLSIRLGDRYSRGQLIEINSHSLFSKWFSESGKLVLKLFKKIREYLENSEYLVCVLIDEVESLAHSRSAAFSGSEPSDSIRVVNAILTQLDQIREYPNVLILTTSNMTGAIDLAFVDRADIKQYIGPPSDIAIYQIYLSCITELMRTGIISPRGQIFAYKTLEACHFQENESTKRSLELLAIAKYSVGLSGRSLRKIPFLAHALFVNSPSVPLKEFLSAMREAIKKHVVDSEVFAKDIEKIKINDS